MERTVRARDSERGQVADCASLWNAYADGNSITSCNSDGDCDIYSDTHGYRDSHTDSYTDGNGYVDSYTYGYANTDTDPDCNSNSHLNADA